MSQRAKKTKRPDLRPARARYWNGGHLRKNKVNRLMKSNGFKTKAEALTFWLSVRKRYKG